MKSSDEYVSILSELGLTTSQAKVFLSLAKSKNLKAHEISSISTVARPDVYRILVQLEKAGLVEKTISKPKEFHAVSIEKCVSHLMQKKLMKTEELQQKALILTQDFKRNARNAEIAEEFQFVLHNSREAVYDKAEKMLRKAQKTICFLALRKRMMAWILNYSFLLEEALARKVDLKIIMPKPELNEHLDEPLGALIKHPNFALRLISDCPHVGFSVWDRKEILLTTSAVDTPYPYPTLWSNNRIIVDLSQNYFDLLWQKAQETKT